MLNTETRTEGTIGLSFNNNLFEIINDIIAIKSK